jgi:Archaea-specific RecJ-like exonuclease, contains DnaJ-type Zn finger domain
MFIITPADDPSKFAYLYWGIPLSLVLLVIPLYNSYSVAKQYAKLIPEYEREAKPEKLIHVAKPLLGKPVRVHGVVQKTSGKLIGRPAFTLYDGTAAAIVQRGAPFTIPINIGDHIECIGMVVRRFSIVGKYVVHVIDAKQADEAEYAAREAADAEEAAKIKIKKY